MPDLRQALKDLVETSNSGKYADDATLMSKFPELKGYDIGVLKDFVATANGGQYATEDELFAKFPEFNLGGPVPQVKKNSQLPLVNGLQGSAPTEELAVGNMGITGLQKVNKPVPVAAPTQAETPKAVPLQTKAPQFVSDLTSSITPEEISKQEETLVPEMNYKYGPLGFKFEEAGYTGNYMKVIAPNGKDAIEVSLGLGSMDKKGEAEKLKRFIQDNSKTVATDKLSAIEEEYKTNKKVYNSQKEIDETVKSLNTEAENLMTAQKVWAKQQDEHNAEVEKFSKIPVEQRATPQYKQQYDALIKQRNELDTKRVELTSGLDGITNKEETLKESVGRYTEMESQKGAWYETVPMALARGAGKLASGFYGEAMDLINQFGPRDMLGVNDEWWQKQSLKSAKKLGYGEPSEGQNATQFLYNLPSQQKSNVEADVRDVLKKRDKGFMVGGEANDPKYLKEKFIELASKKGIEGPKSKTDEAYVSWLNTLSDDVKDELDVEVKKQAQGGQTISEALRNTLSDALPTISTKEYYQKTQQKFIPGAVLGAIESVPAFAFGNKFTRLARLIAQADDATFEEMEKDPDFKNVSENEKRLISMPISIATAVLEEVGFRNIISNKGLLNRITLAALRKSGATTTAKTFGELVRNEVDGMVAKGALTLVGASLAEAETGALQQVAEIAVKDIYNEVKDKKMFDTPQSVGEFIGDVVKAGVQEAIGGFVLGTPSAVGAAYTKKGFLNMTDEQFRQFESMANDGKLQTAFVTSLKNKILNGELSRSEAKEQLNNYRNSVSLYNQLPDNLSIQGKKEAMNLIKEKNALKQQKEGKDDALVVKQTERIAAIDAELGEISNTKSVTNFNEEETVKLAGILLQEKKRQEDVKNYNRKEFLGRDVRIGALEFYKLGLARFKKWEGRFDEYSDEEIEDIINEHKTRISLLERSLNGSKPMSVEQIRDNQSQTQQDTQPTTLEEELRANLPYEYYEGNLNSEYDWQRNTAKEFLADPKAYFERMIESAKEGLQANPDDPISKNVLADNTEKLRLFNEITNKYTTNAIQEQGAATGVPSTEQPQLGLQEMGTGNAQPQGTPPGTQEVVTPEQEQEEVKVLSDKINSFVENSPVKIGNDNRISGGIYAMRFAATEGDKKEDVSTPSKIDFLPESIDLVHLARNESDATSILDNGFDVNEVSMDSPVPGVYFSSEDWDTMDRFGRDKKNGILTTIKNEGLVYFDNAASFRKFLKDNNLPSEGQTLSQEQLNSLKEKGIKGIILREDFASQSKNELIVIDPSIIQKTSKYNGESITKLPSSFSSAQSIAEAYRSAKKNNTNPKLVDLVEKAVSSTTQPAAEVAPVTTTETATITAPEITVEPVAEPVVEPVVEEEPVAEYEPVLVKDTSHDTFTRDNATDYEEGERESDNGRTYTYLAMVKVPLYDADGNTIGYLVKLTDDDNELSWKAEDIDQNELPAEYYDTKGEARQAIVDDYNKKQKKEFDKEAKKAAKKKISDAAKAATKAEKAAAKEAEKAAKAAAKAASTGTTTAPTTTAPVTEAPAVIDTLESLMDADVTTEENKNTILDFLNKADDAITNRLRGGANDALLAIPLSTVQLVVKSLKVLVKGGMMLRDAIRKVAADNGVSQEIVKDILNISEIQDKFDALMLKVDEMVNRQRARGTAQDRMVSNIDTYVRKSEVYQEANDAQKKILEREARAIAGAAERRAPSIGRILGVLKDITNVSRAEKLLVIKRIRDLSKDAAKNLAMELRNMASTGTITLAQAANVLARFGKVNLLNEVSVANFVDYMARVFSDAEYAAKMKFAKSMLASAKRNITSKIGIADGLITPLMKLFSVNPSIIPESVLDKYISLVKMFGEKAAVLTLREKSDVLADVNDILQILDQEQSLVETLLDVVEQYQNKEFDANGNLDLEKTIKNMIDDGAITEDDAVIMRKYRTTFVPRASTKKTQQELDDEKNQLLDDLDNITVNGSGLTTRDERKLANEIGKLIKTSAVRALSNTELKNLLKVIDNINNNYIPHYAEVLKEKMNSINKAKPVVSSINRSILPRLSKVVANVKNLITRKKNVTLTMIERNPLIYLDQVFGDFKTQDLYNALLLDASIGDAAYKSELKVVQELLEKAEQKVAESFKLDPDATLMSKYKMMTYMIQLEYLSNPGNEQVNEAAKYINETIKFIESSDASRYTDRDVKMLEKILSEFAQNGEVDINKLYATFNSAEKAAIDTVRKLNESLREKAEFTAAIIRGDRISPLNNYVHLNVLQDPTQRDASSSSPSDIANMSNMMNPSTKAKSLIKRTKGAKALNFDIFASAQRGAKFVLMDYNLTSPIRTARMTLNNAKKALEVNGRIPKEERDKINALESAFRRAVENLLLNSFTNSTTTEEVIDYISKQGYRAVLAGTTRFTSELMSNIGFALITDPKAMSEGVKYRKLMMSEDALSVLQNVSSTQITRIIPTASLSGSMVDTSILRQTGGVRGGRAMNPVANKINQLWNRSGKKYTNSVEFVADALISTPDKLIMRPMWFGSFANAFKAETGDSPDFDLIAKNDEAYMSRYKEALNNAKTVADGRVVLTGATDNAFMGILKGTAKVDDGVVMKAFNNFNNYMTKFLIFEYVTARTGIAAAMGNGMITKKQGYALIAGVTTRMTVYTLLTQMMGTGLMGLLFGGDDEEEDEKSLLQKFGQQLVASFTSLLFGRDFGQGVRGILNIGLEEFNKEYLDGLREGKYDPYKDAIQYPIIPPEKKGRQTDLFDIAVNMTGSFSPAMKTADFMVRKALEAPKKKEDAVERTNNEIGIRIPLEVAGNAGFIPLYKDIRKVVMNELYKDLRLADERAADKKRAAEEKLHGYKNSEDMKRYAPELWDVTFGPNSAGYDVNEAKKRIKREKAKIERERLDDLYNYTPKRRGSKSSFGGGEKKKSSFGGRGFGSENKNKGGFGSGTFGRD